MTQHGYSLKPEGKLVFNLSSYHLETSHQVIFEHTQQTGNDDDDSDDEEEEATMMLQP
jgi:hypothetical protein